MDGGVVRDDKLSLYHFNVGWGRIYADFTPSAISFQLSSPGVDGTYPIVKLSVSVPGESEQRQLGSGTVKGQFSQKFDLENAKPGMYGFWVWYGDTDPKVDKRPVLTIDSVELLK